VTRYLDMCREIAGRVIAGELGVGAELPSIRGLAHQQHTTPSTVSRSYRHLAHVGVIAQTDRRRARIAPEGALAARSLLATARDFRLAGSDDPALDLVLREAGRAVVTVGPAAAFTASLLCGAGPRTEPRSTCFTVRACTTPRTHAPCSAGASPR
jgi:DNA-binding transcriptional MocR family regulator